MSTFGAMKQSVFSVLRDSEKAFVTDSEVGEWLNEAYTDLSARMRLLKKTETGTTSGTGTISLPTDWLELAVLTINTDVPTFVSQDLFRKYANRDESLDTTIAIIWNGVIETYPARTSETYTMQYYYQPDPMTNQSDVPLLPPELHTRLVHYARGMAKLKEAEIEEANIYMGWYERGLPDMPRGWIRENPGPVDLVPEDTGWEGLL